MAPREQEARAGSRRERLLRIGQIGVRFFLRDDRYAHDIVVADGESWQVVLKSLEGTPEDAWPASPPLQSLHVETRGDDRQLALLVGMAGKSHWSASVELDPQTGRITFDVACRVRASEAGTLGSSYRTSEPVDATDTRRIVIECGGAQVICQSLGDACLHCDAQSANIVASASAETGPRTIRWGYVLWRA